MPLRLGIDLRFAVPFGGRSMNRFFRGGGAGSFRGRCFCGSGALRILGSERFLRSLATNGVPRAIDLSHWHARGLPRLIRLRRIGFGARGELGKCLCRRVVGAWLREDIGRLRLTHVASRSSPGWLLRASTSLLAYEDAYRSDREETHGREENGDDSCRHERASILAFFRICVKCAAIFARRNNAPASTCRTSRIGGARSCC